MKVLKPVLLATVFSLTAGLASAATIGVPSGVYKNDEQHTNVLWSVKHFGLSNYYGRFDKITVTLDLNSEDVQKSKVSATIDPKSVDTNFHATPNTFNEEIASSKFFDTDKFNTITFKSTDIKLIGDKTGEMTGDLTFHGVTKPVTLKVTFNTALNPSPMTKKPAVGFSATGTIKRSDFGVNTLVGPVSDDVQLTIEAEFEPAK